MLIVDEEFFRGVKIGIVIVLVVVLVLLILK